MILVTFHDALNAFLKSNAFIIALVMVGIIVITFAIIILLGLKKNKK